MYILHTQKYKVHVPFEKHQYTKTKIVILLPTHTSIPPSSPAHNTHTRTHARTHARMHTYTIQLSPKCPLHQTRYFKKKKFNEQLNINNS